MYKVTIEKIDNVKFQSKQRRDTKRPATEKDLQGLPSYRVQELEVLINSGKIPTVDEYYYEPSTETREVRKEIFQQTVEEIDLPMVIRAINNI